jgi:hypothetical protein
MSIFKILIYSLLFIILCPGFIVNLHPTNKGYFLSEETSYISIIIHTFVLAALIIIIENRRYLDAKSIETELTRIDTKDVLPIITIILFILLSPGLILTLSPGQKNIFFTGQTCHIAVLIHSILFILLLGLTTYYLNNIKKILNI